MYEYNENYKGNDKRSENEINGNTANTSYAKPIKNKKKHGTFTKVVAVMGAALLFGSISAVTFQGVNHLMNKCFGDDTKVQSKADALDKADEIDIGEFISGKDTESGDSSGNASDSDATTVAPVEIGKSKDTINPDNVSSSGSYTVEEVASAAMPSIVAITNKSVQEVRSYYGMGTQQYESTSAGSGIIIGQSDSELLIATNAHVIENANTLSVCFIDNEVCEAQIKGSDSANDIALISVKLTDIKDDTLNSIKIAKIGNSEDLVIGEQVVAIGNALGYGQSVTTGIVSALNRNPDGSDDSDGYIQTDAAINPGNSGGALLNMKGEVIGINSAKLASTMIEGMGYAIPIDAANPVFENLINLSSRGLADESEAGYLGITGFTVDSQAAEEYGIPCGVYIAEVSANGAADNAGLKKGDVIVKFDGMDINSIEGLKENIAYYKIGETVDLVIKRSDNGEYIEQTVSVTLTGKNLLQEFEDEFGINSGKGK